MFVNDWYKSCALTACYEGEEGGDPPPANPDKVDEVKPPEGFTPDQQKKFNDAIAAERRKQETKYRKELEKTEATYKELLANSKSLTEKERQTLQDNLETIQGQLRSKEQQAAQEKKELEAAYQGKLTAAEQRAVAAEQRWRDSTIMRALQDAAVENEAYNTRQVTTLLKDWTKLVEGWTRRPARAMGQFKVMVEFPGQRRHDWPSDYDHQDAERGSQADDGDCRVPKSLPQERRLGCRWQFGYRWPYTGFQRTD